MSITAPINVALVGYGFAGRLFHAPLIDAVDGLRLHTIVTSQEGLARADWPEARVRHAYADALADPEVAVVVLATPNAVHAEQAHAALEGGKHVVVDKPFTVTVEEAEGVVAHAERAGRLLAVFHNRRWDGDFLTVKRLIAEGALGDVRYFESRIDRYRPAVRDRWRERTGRGAGLWYDLGPHLLDQALQLFGAPLSIDADLAIQREGGQVDDYFHVVLKYPRLRVVLHASMLAAANDLRFAVHGTRGSYIKFASDPQEEVLRAGGGAAGGVGGAEWGVDRRAGVLTVYEGDKRVERSVESERGDWRRFYSGVRDAIAGSAPSPVPASEALLVMRLLERGAVEPGSHSEIEPTR